MLGKCMSEILDGSRILNFCGSVLYWVGVKLVLFCTVWGLCAWGQVLSNFVAEWGWVGV